MMFGRRADTQAVYDQEPPHDCDSLCTTIRPLVSDPASEQLLKSQVLLIIMPSAVGEGGIKLYRDTSVRLSHGAAVLGAHLP